MDIQNPVPSPIIDPETSDKRKKVLGFFAIVIVAGLISYFLAQTSLFRGAFLEPGSPQELALKEALANASQSEKADYKITYEKKYEDSEKRETGIVVTATGQIDLAGNGAGLVHNFTFEGTGRGDVPSSEEPVVVPPPEPEVDDMTFTAVPDGNAIKLSWKDGENLQDAERTKRSYRIYRSEKHPVDTTGEGAIINTANPGNYLTMVFGNSVKNNYEYIDNKLLENGKKYYYKMLVRNNENDVEKDGMPGKKITSSLTDEEYNEKIFIIGYDEADATAKIEEEIIPVVQGLDIAILSIEDWNENKIIIQLWNNDSEKLPLPGINEGVLDPDENKVGAYRVYRSEKGEFVKNQDGTINEAELFRYTILTGSDGKDWTTGEVLTNANGDQNWPETKVFHDTGNGKDFFLGDTHTYLVATLNTNGEILAFSNEKEIQWNPPQSIVLGAPKSKSAAKVEWEWTHDYTGNEVAKYVLYRSTQTPVDLENTANIVGEKGFFSLDGKKFSDTKALQENQTYYYRIVATGWGKNGSLDGGKILATSEQQTVIIPKSLPTTIEKPQLMVIGEENQIRLVWKDATNPANIKRYGIFKTEMPLNPPKACRIDMLKQVGQVGPNEKSWIDTTIDITTDKNKVYCYSIKTVDIKNELHQWEDLVSGMILGIRLSPKEIKSNSVKLAWTGTEELLGKSIIPHKFFLHRSTEKDFLPTPENLILDKEAKSHEDMHEDTGLANGAQYFYKVIERHRYGSGKFLDLISNEVAVIPNTDSEDISLDDSIQLSVAGVGDKEVHLQWTIDDAQEPDDKMCKIYRSTTKNFTVNEESNIFEVNCQDSSTFGDVSKPGTYQLINGKTYYYRVGMAGQETPEGDSETPLLAISNEVAAIPNSPMLLSAAALGDKKNVQLTWTSDTLEGDGKFYKIIRSAADMKDFTQIFPAEDFAKLKNTYTDNASPAGQTEAIKGKTYHYRIEIYGKNTSGTGEKIGTSNEQSVIPNPADQFQMLLSAAALGDKKRVELTWTSDTLDGNEKFYKIIRSAADIVPWTFTFNATEFTALKNKFVDDLSPDQQSEAIKGKTYHYRIEIYKKNSAGIGEKIGTSNETAVIPNGNEEIALDNKNSFWKPFASLFSAQAIGDIPAQYQEMIDGTGKLTMGANGLSGTINITSEYFKENGTVDVGSAELTLNIKDNVLKTSSVQMLPVEDALAFITEEYIKTKFLDEDKLGIKSFLEGYAATLENLKTGIKTKISAPEFTGADTEIQSNGTFTTTLKKMFAYTQPDAAVEEASLKITLDTVKKLPAIEGVLVLKESSKFSFKLDNFVPVTPAAGTGTDAPTDNQLPPPPPAPESLTLELETQGDRTIKIRWVDVPGAHAASGYQIFRYETGNTALTGVQGIPQTAEKTNFTDTASLVNGKTYYYVMTAVDAANAVLRTSNTLPVTLTGIVLSHTIAEKEVKMSWVDATAGVEKYTIFRSEVITAKGTEIVSVGKDTKTYNDTPATPVSGKTYYYSIIATDLSGTEIAISNQIAATPLAADCPAMIVYLKAKKTAFDTAPTAANAQLYNDQYALFVAKPCTAPPGVSLPTGLTAVPEDIIVLSGTSTGDQNITLSWEDTKYMDGNEYYLYRTSPALTFKVGDSAAGIGETAKIKGKIYKDTVPENEKTYFYVVALLDANKKITKISNTISAISHVTQTTNQNAPAAIIIGSGGVPLIFNSFPFPFPFQFQNQFPKPVGLFPVPSSLFVDINPQTYGYDAIMRLAQAGVIEGYKENGFSIFKPQKSVTRAEASKLILAAACVNVSEAAKIPPKIYTDVSPEVWFFKYTKEAYLRGYFTGYKNKKGPPTFKPERTITRAELTKVLVEVLRRGGAINVPTIQQTAPWWIPYLQIGTDIQIITDEQAIFPTQPLTRAETAVMVDRVKQMYNGCQKYK